MSERRQRGMTLLEVVLSLGLMSILMLASGWWLREVAMVRARAEARLNWEAAAYAFLQRIEDDVRAGDFTEEPDEPRLELTLRGFSIETRRRGSEGGAVRVDYRHERARGELLRAGGSARSRHPVPLLQRVADFEAQLDEDANELTVSVASQDGRRISRRFVLE